MQRFILSGGLLRRTPLGSSMVQSFVCRQCLLLRDSRPRAALAKLRPPQQLPWRVRSRPTSTSSSAPAPASASTSAAAAVPRLTGRSEIGGDRVVGYWLLGSAASVFGIVVWGGLTRLTESGLSITEWRPVTGTLPPRSAADWEAEFAKYRASPEYRQLNPNMSLDEFRRIYYMEWAHRVWGRVIGVTFVLPAVYFAARRRVTARLAGHLAGVSALIGLQGVLGWWMVRSGLRDDLFAPGAHPRVSQYRLAAHLGAAFACYSWMLLLALSVLRKRPMPATAATVTVTARFRRKVLALGGLVFTTAMSGALVAGLDAGMIYNDFPLMGGSGLTPPWAELWSRFYARHEDGADLWWRNMFENPSLVQLEHRILAMTTLTAVLALFAHSRWGRGAAALPAEARRGAVGLVHLALAQAALGISTLMLAVPTGLAAAHQAGSLALLTGVLVLAHRLRLRLPAEARSRARAPPLLRRVSNVAGRQGRTT